MPRKTEHIPVRHILLRLAHGWTLARMGDDFGLTADQMRYQTRLLYEKLGVSEAAHAVQIAHNKRMIQWCPSNCEFCELEKARKNEGS